MDHIISEKHGGQTVTENLAYACVFCNRSKGSDVGSITHDTQVYVRFYHPRLDTWHQHFKLDGIHILALTDVGGVTVSILGFNNAERLFEREALQKIGRYPSPSAMPFLPGRP